ncbi:MAG: hypothetical protein KIS77_04910 [Saprospiraceae bacterium]|nr:hypothetical protein [Saprospiraceae bacterium]
MKKSLFLAASLFLLNAFAFAQSAEDIIAKHIKAIGGDNWSKVNSIKMEATIAAEAAAGMTISYSMTAIRDKAARMDVSVMGMNQVSVVNGDKGWTINPFAGQTSAEPLTPDQVKNMMDQTDIDGTIIGYKEKGYKVEYVGKEDVEGTEALKIKVDKGEGKLEYLLYDPESYYEIKNVRVDNVDGQEVETATIYSNFKAVDGITMPYTMQQANPMMGSTTISLTKVTLNPTVDEKIFEMPKK